MKRKNDKKNDNELFKGFTKEELDVIISNSSCKLCWSNAERYTIGFFCALPDDVKIKLLDKYIGTIYKDDDIVNRLLDNCNDKKSIAEDLYFSNESFKSFSDREVKNIPSEEFEYFSHSNIVGVDGSVISL